MPQDDAPHPTDQDDDDAPAPEQGSPEGDPQDVPDDAAAQVEKGEPAQVNPLAPPGNAKAGS